jgi:hypothetical protein
LQLSNKGKIVLILLGVLVIAFVILYFLDKKTQSEIAATESPSSEDIYAPGTTEATQSQTAGGEALESPQSADQIIGLSPTASATTGAGASASATKSTTKTARTPISTIDKNGVRTYKIAITPAPNAGPLDWTVTEKEIVILDSTASPYNKFSLCKLTGLSDSWSNSIEKIACDSVNFLSEKLLEPMGQMACAFHASELQLNYNNKISYEYKGGACLIIDR